MSSLRLDEKSSIKVDKTEIVYVGKDVNILSKDIFNHSEYNKVLRVNLSHNCFKNVSWLSVFFNLVELNLDNNRISEDSCFPCLENLQTLSLNNNNIGNLPKILKTLSSSFKQLHYLGILGNPMCPSIALNNYEDEYEKFRKRIINSIPSLQFLDWRPVSNNEKKLNTIKQLEEYAPLPVSKNKIGDHKGAVGKVKYTYVGKQSEGNRFIRNQHL